MVDTPGRVTVAGTVAIMEGVADAEELAGAKLSDVLPRRWRHVRSVARRARWVAKTLGLPDDLVAAVWLHDIGYAPGLVATGFHPLDGARYLRSVGLEEAVVSLVAYHSCAYIEAEVRGLGAELASEFAPGEPLLADALLYCDMTTGPDADYVRPADRWWRSVAGTVLITWWPVSWSALRMWGVSWPRWRWSRSPCALPGLFQRGRVAAWRASACRWA